MRRNFAASIRGRRAFSFPTSDLNYIAKLVIILILSATNKFVFAWLNVDCVAEEDQACFYILNTCVIAILNISIRRVPA